MMFLVKPEMLLPEGESVSILVGPNGSGKSSYLRDIATMHRYDRSVTVVCNTPHDRFEGVKRVKRMSLGRLNGSPKAVVKDAIAQSLDADNSQFHFISAILEQCGYTPRFGFRLKPAKRYGRPVDEVLLDASFGSPNRGLRRADPDDMEKAVHFLTRFDPSETLWIDTTGSLYEFSRAREFAAVLRCERALRSERMLTGIEVYLERYDDGEQIELQHASSGQLSLISTLLFIIASAGKNPVIVIDEPENSLHPSWQRDYVGKLMDALTYRNATVLIATHAPMVVTGALASNQKLVNVYEVLKGLPRLLDIDPEGSPASGIEEVLWRAFDIVTPANHFVSESIVAAMTEFEEGRSSKSDFLALVDDLDAQSFDDRQKRFFGAVRDLADKVEAAHDEADASDA
ncbi:AAA domain-containing protein, putative AbiEii toxin, Type IV TA system [Sphingomonas sp. OK281]|nr:AAA domain-containing protein, putative AbiEii toxin, Type IV TA system [Sphingomonas sp. OK281]